PMLIDRLTDSAAHRFLVPAYVHPLADASDSATGPNRSERPSPGCHAADGNSAAQGDSSLVVRIWNKPAEVSHSPSTAPLARPARPVSVSRPHQADDLYLHPVAIDAVVMGDDDRLVLGVGGSGQQFVPILIEPHFLDRDLSL